MLYRIMLSVVVGTLAAGAAHAYVASSTNYRMQSDSINFGGGLSTSSQYKLEDTLGEIGTGESGSATYELHAGYQQMHEVYLALSAPADVTLAPSLDRIQGGIAEGSAGWNVTTDNPAGYSLSVQASTDPALKSSTGSFANYTPSGTVDFSWSVAEEAAEFGFTPQGADVAQAFLDNGSQCGTGSSESADRCWAPLKTSATVVGRSSGGNHPAGATTTLKFRAEVGADQATPLQGGSYNAVVTATVIAL